MPKLINWHMERRPESKQYIMWGTVYGNPRFPDGHEIHTSTVQKIKRLGRVLHVQTRNTLYECDLAMHDLNEKEYEILQEALELYGFPKEEAARLTERMQDAFFPLGEKKKEMFRRLLAKSDGICNILEFSSEERDYFRFLARKGAWRIRFWDQSRLHVTVGRDKLTAEVRSKALQNEGICFSFQPGPDGPVLERYPVGYGKVLVRNGGLEPFTVRMEEHSCRVLPGECMEL